MAPLQTAAHQLTSSLRVLLQALVLVWYLRLVAAVVARAQVTQAACEHLVRLPQPVPPALDRARATCGVPLPGRQPDGRQPGLTKYSTRSRRRYGRRSPEHSAWDAIRLSSAPSATASC